MNEKEFLVVMKALAVAYDRNLDEEKIDLWQHYLKEEDFQTTLEAVDRWIKRDPRFPRVSELLDEIHPKDEWIYPEEEQPALEFKHLANAAHTEMAKEACSIVFGLCDKSTTKLQAAERCLKLHEKFPHINPSWKFVAGLLAQGKRLLP